MSSVSDMNCVGVIPKLSDKFYADLMEKIPWNTLEFTKTSGDYSEHPEGHGDLWRHLGLLGSCLYNRPGLVSSCGKCLSKKRRLPNFEH